MQRLRAELWHPAISTAVSFLSLLLPQCVSCRITIDFVCRLLAKSNRLTTTRNAVWALSNLCRGKNPPPEFDKVSLCAMTGLGYRNPFPIIDYIINSCIFVHSYIKLSLPLLSLCQVCPSLSVLSRLLFSSDSDVLADACWALSYLSDGPNEKIQTVIDSGVCRRLVELLM